jgi:predicted phage tail protein
MLLELRRSFDMNQTVRLLGDLGERYGVEHSFQNLRTPAEAIKLLCHNFPEFLKEICHAHEHGIAYELVQAGTHLALEDLQLPLGSNDLILAPVVVGSGGGFSKTVGIIVGVALAVVSFGIGAIASAGVTLGGLAGIGTVATIGVALGGAIALLGVSQLLSPQPLAPTLDGLGSGSYGGVSTGRFGASKTISNDLGGPSAVERGTSGKSSYAYSGPANTVGVGKTIPVAYGEVLIGSHLLSANIDIADDSDPLKDYVRTPGPDTIMIGGEKVSYSVQFIQDSRIQRMSASEAVSANSSAQVFPAAYLPLSNGSTVNTFNSGGPIDWQNYWQNAGIVFALDNGLGKNVSGTGSTVVDGFITYQFEVVMQYDYGQQQTIAQARATVQGLLTGSSQQYFFSHNLKLPDLRNAGRVWAVVTMIDSGTFSTSTFRVVRFGLNAGYY